MSDDDLAFESKISRALRENILGITTGNLEWETEKDLIINIWLKSILGISELEKAREKDAKDLEKWGQEVYKELNELKEYIIDTKYSEIIRIKNIEKVLRELIIVLRGWVSIEDNDYQEIEKLLEKLDGKKEGCEWETTEYCMKPDETPEEDLVDSGGEKDNSGVEVPNRVKGNIPQIKPDSKPPEIEEFRNVDGKLIHVRIKPPEPAMGKKCLTCNGWNPNEYASECEDIYNTIELRCEVSDEPRENDYTCRLCGNEISEVEYEVNKLTVEVKWEHLQRWKKEFEKIGHPEWEYIEEEYEKLK